MKKIFWLVLLAPLAFIFLYWYDNYNVGEQKKQEQSSPTGQIQQKREFNKTPAVESTSVFVPYWTFKNSLNVNGDDLLYFGVTVSLDGINKEEDGYKKISQFKKISLNHKKLLTVRMLNNDINFKTLDDENLQNKIIADSIQIAKENGFDGLVLDLEISAISFDNFVKKIGNFIDRFGSQVHTSHLTFGMATYGDTFYRARPFDIAQIEKNVDHLYVMTYDFHKARGTPGPNFPFEGKETYGYDFKKMIDDFLEVVPSSKLTIVMGMFGYDWIVDSEGRSKGTAAVITLYQAKEKFLNTCALKNCEVVVDPQTFEVKVTYLDDANEKHIVWFETEKSAEAKKEYAKTKGIGGVGYWAYSYY